MNNSLKKLNLNQEVLRNLTPNELQRVAGGFGTHTCHASADCGTHTCTEPTTATCVCTTD